MSKYVIQLTTSDTIEVKEYIDYNTINELVDGWYEIGGYLGKKYLMYCNEEALLEDKCTFNALATIINGRQPIYGNTVLMIDGYNDNKEYDTFPMSIEDAEKLKDILESFIKQKKDLLVDMHNRFDNKPKLY